MLEKGYYNRGREGGYGGEYIEGEIWERGAHGWGVGVQGYMGTKV